MRQRKTEPRGRYRFAQRRRHPGQKNHQRTPPKMQRGRVQVDVLPGVAQMKPHLSKRAPLEVRLQGVNRILAGITPRDWVIACVADAYVEVVMMKHPGAG